MKKLFLVAFFTGITTLSFAQTKFEKAMTEKIGKVNQHLPIDEYQKLSDDFIRIASAEKTQWLPYYYASLAQIKKGRTLMMENKISELDAIAAEAQKSLDKAFELDKENAELYILQKMIHGIKMMVNPMERWKTEGQAAQEALSKAKALDSNNPRITILEAEDLYFTPEQFGGSKQKGIELFKKALEQFQTYQPKSEIHPNWGRENAEYFVKNKP